MINDLKINLTDANLLADNSFTMRGGIRTKEKCPKCYSSFSGKPLHCPACLTTPKRHFIDLYEKGYGRLKLYSDKQGHPLDSYQRTQRVLEHIRYEIDQHIFDPKKYIAADIKEFRFENRIENWYQSKLKEVEKGNLAENYSRILKCYIEHYYLSFFKGMDVREIRTFHIQQFYEQLPNKSLKYCRNILDALRNFLNSLVRFEYISQRPLFPAITLDRKVPRWLDYEDQIKILNTINPEDSPIYYFLALQGVRPGEARALKAKDINLKNNSLIIARTYSGSKLRERVKSKVVRPRLMNPALASMLKELCKDKLPDAFVFVNPRTGKPYSYNILFKIWDRARKESNINITLYEATRHSVASIAACNGAPLTAIQDVLGHTDIRTTLKYAHTNLESQQVVFQKKAAEIKKLSLKNNV